MKNLILSLNLILMGFTATANSGSMIGGGDEFVCVEPIAFNRATNLVHFIGNANGYTEKAKAQLHHIEDKDGNFYITIYFDLGLSVPAYTVKIQKSNCNILDVQYSNFEG